MRRYCFSLVATGFLVTDVFYDARCLYNFQNICSVRYDIVISAHAVKINLLVQMYLVGFDVHAACECRL